MSDAQVEIDAGERFGFGENWARFLDLLDDDRIAQAEQSLRAMLGVERLDGKTFLDVGSGSGLFSLAARNLGAHVRSFDFDQQSVECALELRRRYHPHDHEWSIEQGSVLDVAFVESLGKFDVVYSGGVLHHTGAMWEAIANVAGRVEQNGQLFISIYNDQGRKSRVWRRIKRLYSSGGKLQQAVILRTAAAGFAARSFVPVAYATVRGLPRNRQPRARGMDRRRDLVDWVGGYPFEVALPHEIFDAVTAKGFELKRMVTCGPGLGCNEFVFVRSHDG